MAKIVRSALERVLTGAFGIAAVTVVFAGLVSLMAEDAVSFAPSEVRRIEFRFTPPDERLDIKDRGEKATRESTVQLPVAPIGSLGPCVDCSTVPQPTVALHAFGFDRHELGENGSVRGMDADPQPIVRIPPEYPAHGRGNGWVLVQFDISPAGSVVNARVIDASPRGVLEKSALRAIERWRYRPAVIEGRASERRGLRVKLSFVLEEA